MKHTILIDNETTATIDGSTIDFQPIENFIGERMTAQATDENGNTVDVTGIITEILE